MNLTRRRWNILAACSALAAHSPVRAAAGSTRIFVGFPAGGLPDRVARAIAPGLQAAFDRPVVVENMPGANGRLAGQALKKTPPDGAAYFVAPASNIVHLPHLYNLGYDPLVDFAPVAQCIANDFCFAISAKIPCNTLTEFAAWCKANPGQSNFSSPGIGSALHLHGLMLGKALDVRLLHVPYRGSVQALGDLMGGHLSSIMATTVSLIPQHQAGGLRILATTARTRSRVLPQVPTFAELGMDQLTFVEGTWVLTRADTPQALVGQAARAVIESVQGKEMQELLDNHTVAAPMGAAELMQRMRADFEARGALIKRMGFSASA